MENLVLSCKAGQQELRHFSFNNLPSFREGTGQLPDLRAKAFAYQ